MTYEPTLPPEHVERIRRWHERAYAAARAEAGDDGRTFHHLGLTLHVPPQVQPIAGMSHPLGEAVLAEARDGDRVLDMGTGCGVNAILAASRSRDVVAVDVNPHAVEAARGNAARNGVADRVTVLESDVFAAVEGDFDLIVFDPPFRWFAPRDLLERATTDAGYAALTRFFRDVRGYLRPGGRVLLFFGTTGDLPYVRRLVGEAGFAATEVSREELVRDGWRVEYVTFRLTRDATRPQGDRAGGVGDGCAEGSG
ncbi:methyltransferase [Nonomuraea harbinensis]|uniref:Methyltransferase n=1 Tax=Nonomuraea harbinensis TaxID=1286938 RepID=A0ABW1BUC8_9ACTN|nr:methyltransferase [Nonomuraea harbinensis]